MMPPEQEEEVNALKQALEEQGKTGAHMAEAVRVRRATAYKWINQGFVGDTHVAQVALWLDVSETFLRQKGATAFDVQLMGECLDLLEPALREQGLQVSGEVKARMLKALYRDRVASGKLSNHILLQVIGLLRAANKAS